MAFAQAQLDALEEAIAEGADEVRYGDRAVRYKSMKDMLALRDKMRRDLSLAGDGSTRVLKLSAFSKGTT